MKNKRTIWEFICFLGLPWVFILLALGVYLYPQLSGRSNLSLLYRLSEVWRWALLGGILILLKNCMWLGTDKKIGLFSWMEPYKYEPPKTSGRKNRAQYPPIPREYLSSKPDGLTLAKRGKKYVRVNIERGKILNTIIFGSVGCGKSVLLLTMLLYQLNRKPTKRDPAPMVFYVTDIKPELGRKSTKLQNNPKVRYMDIRDRKSYGWDVYYNLKSTSTDDEIIESLDVIARALIDAGKAEKNEFFYQHARTIFKAIHLWQYRMGRSFMQAMDYIMTGSIADVIKKTIEKVQGKPEYKMVYKLLSPYLEKDGEAFEGIELAFRQCLDIFSQQSVVYFLDTNPQKASPEDLEAKISVFFAIQETKLKEYRGLLRLVTMQIMDHCSRRPENAHMLTLLVDEAAKIGIDWTDFLATSRSRQISTILAMQSIGQAQDIWGKDKTRTLLELCRVHVILSCTDPEFARTLSDWAGTYKEEKRSVNNTGKNKGSSSSSFEDKKVLEQSDIMDLQDLKEVILFIKGQYFRADVEGARYYNIKELNKLSEKMLAINDKNDEKED